MRPISLVIDGINSFSERQTVDFDFDGLFCICGDTGSGKTTILDCIILALYGSGKHASSIGDYVNLRRDRAEIRFVFETTTTDGERHRYEVFRSFTRDGIKGSRLTDLTSGRTIAEQSNNVTAAITEMIGLKKDDFTQVVILEQGKFAKFLTATKKERNETVGNLFKLYKYKDLGSKVKKYVDMFKKDVDYLGDRIGELKDVTATAIREGEKELDELGRRTELVNARINQCSAEIARIEEIARRYEECLIASQKAQELNEKLETLHKRSEAAEANAKESDQRLKALSEQRAQYEINAERIRGISALGDEHIRRMEELKKLRTEWVEADKVCAECRDQIDNLYEKARNTQSILDSTIKDIFLIAKLSENGDYYDVFDIKSKAEKLISNYEVAQANYAECDKKVQDLTRRVNFDTNNLAHALELVAAAESRRNELKNELGVLRLRRETEIKEQAADLIREGLKIGDICPVCGEIVQKEPTHTKHADSSDRLKDLEAEYAEADAQYNTVGNNRHSFATRLDESRKALDEATKRRSESEERFQSASKIILAPDRISELPSLTQNACALMTELTMLSNKLGVMTEKLRAETAKADDIKLRGERERAAVDRLEQLLREKRGTYEPIVTEEQIERLKDAIAEETGKNEQLKAERANLASELGSNLAMAEHYASEAGKMPEYDPSALEAVKAEDEMLKAEREKLISDRAALMTRLTAMKTDLERKRSFEADRAEKRKRLDVYTDIYKLVQGDRFIEYVAEEYILQFTEAASSVLSDITGGKYTLEYSGGCYYVRDFLSGGMERKASTLSGGETFLASLALAIAISREIARYKSYEFFFLDEGFGTLDAGSIETVVNALVSLSNDTLVGVVTHRSELTERIFDKIVVISAGEGRGSVITRSD